MILSAWIEFCGDFETELREAMISLLRNSGVLTSPAPADQHGFGIVAFREVGSNLLNFFHSASRHSTVLGVFLAKARVGSNALWSVLEAGATDVLVWPEVPDNADDIAARIERWDAIQYLLASPRVAENLIGESPRWRALLREVIEIARFSDTTVLVVGQSGTGKELIASLIHDLDTRRDNHELVVADCTTIAPELAGSELFGHERGAFTGALNAREGAFSLANGGTLFLDELGELPLPLQAQLLRVIQEGKYKRVGGNIWQHTAFRLVSATNRNLEAAVAEGGFRGDLFHRISGYVCRTPPLKERCEDILPLTAHFLRTLKPEGDAAEIDDAVKELLVTRDYPGNVRELKQLVTRIWHRHTGPGPITIGDVPQADRQIHKVHAFNWCDQQFESAIRQAVTLGVGLKEISHAAAEAAIEAALDTEKGNLRRAAHRLGVTNRALQMRRANQRSSH